MKEHASPARSPDLSRRSPGVLLGCRKRGRCRRRPNRLDVLRFHSSRQHCNQQHAVRARHAQALRKHYTCIHGLVRLQEVPRPNLYTARAEPGLCRETRWLRRSVQSPLCENRRNTTRFFLFSSLSAKDPKSEASADGRGGLLPDRSSLGRRTRSSSGSPTRAPLDERISHGRRIPGTTLRRTMTPPSVEPLTGQTLCRQHYIDQGNGQLFR